MASPTSINLALYVDHIRTAFDEVIKNVQPGDKEDYDIVFHPDTVKEKVSSYSIPLDMPLPTMNTGDIEEVGMKKDEVNYRLVPITQSVVWGVEEDDFDMSKKKLSSMATEAGDHFKNLCWYALAELLEGTAGSAGTRYYETFPYAYDSLGLISSTTRGGVTNGNSQASTGVDKVESILTDITKGFKCFSSYKNTRNGNYMWKLGQNTRFLFLIPGDLAGIFEEVLNTKFVARAIANVAGVENVGGATSNNPWGGRFKYRVLDQLTSATAWYMVISDPGRKTRKVVIDLNKQGYDPYEYTPFINPTDYYLRKTRNRAVVFETYKTVAPMSWANIIKFS